jgi:hypothetical protein
VVAVGKQTVEAKLRRRTHSGLFRGGEGPDTDIVNALEQWVEKGKTPESMIASHITNAKVDCTRLLCSYPGGG